MAVIYIRLKIHQCSRISSYRWLWVARDSTVLDSADIGHSRKCYWRTLLWNVTSVSGITFRGLKYFVFHFQMLEIMSSLLIVNSWWLLWSLEVRPLGRIGMGVESKLLCCGLEVELGWGVPVLMSHLPVCTVPFPREPFISQTPSSPFPPPACAESDRYWEPVAPSSASSLVEIKEFFS